MRGRFWNSLASKLMFFGLVFFSLFAVYWASSFAPETQSPVYKRTDYRHWIDEDNNGLDTRAEVLIEESLIPVTLSNGRVISGLWADPYTGETNDDPALLDIDHVVPLQNAHISGAWRWSASKKASYANDLGDKNHLIAVSRRANRQKGAKPPSQWLPPNAAYRLTYISNWIEIKRRWGLDIEPETLSLWSNAQSP